MKSLPSNSSSGARDTTGGFQSDTGSDLTCVTGADAVQEGHELFLTYGTHPQGKMLMEYGFINIVADEAFRSGEFPSEVDVQDNVQRLFEEKGEAGIWMRQILEEEGYWG